jgi:HipA N-terminal domain
VSARWIKHQASVCVGRAAIEVGDLTFVRDGHREYSAFAYDRSWLRHADRLEISPDLPLREGHGTRRAASEDDSPFPAALASTEPDTWGKRIIQRAHAKRRQRDPALGPLSRFDILAAVDDFSRVGALRLRDANGQFLRSESAFRTPQLVELNKIYTAARAVEQNTETEADLRYLQGKATSLGGLRPKCTVLDADGAQALGKFPSITDTRSIVRGEVLALKLARLRNQIDTIDRRRRSESSARSRSRQAIGHRTHRPASFVCSVELRAIPNVRMMTVSKGCVTVDTQICRLYKNSKITFSERNSELMNFVFMSE